MKTTWNKDLTQIPNEEGFKLEVLLYTGLKQATEVCYDARYDRYFLNAVDRASVTAWR